MNAARLTSLRATRRLFRPDPLTGGLVFWVLPSGGGSPPGPKTAATVDQLSLTQPNPGFVEAASGALEQAGYPVDYYPGEQVTVGGLLQETFPPTAAT